MRMVLRSLGLTLFVSACVVFAASTTAAQSNCDDAEGIAALDAKVRDNYRKDDTLEIAINAAKEFRQKYGECPTGKDFAAWTLKEQVNWDRRLAIYKEIQWRKPRVDKFDNGILSKNYDDVYSAGAELVQRYPDDVNFLLPLGLIGLGETYRNNLKYNDAAIKYAKSALTILKSGTPEPKKKDGKPLRDADGNDLFGPFHFERNKRDAVSELTYATAYMLYYGKKDKRAGLLYFYEASMLPGPYKNVPRLFATVGEYYLDEAEPIGKEVVALLEKQKAAVTEEEKQKIDAEIKPKAALFNGYNARAVDAFSRAYQFFDEKIPAEKALKNQLFSKLAGLIGTETKEALDKKVAGVMGMPFPDPTSVVTPIEEADAPADPTPALPSDVRAKPGPAKTRPATRRPGA